MSATQSMFPSAALADPEVDRNDDGLRLVLTPIQLQAILTGQSITGPETFMNRLLTRIGGGAELVVGAAELTGAAGLLAAPEPTMLTKAGGVVLGANGLDNAGTGLYQLWTGHDRATMTSQAAAEAALALGANPSTAKMIGVIVEIAVPIVVCNGLGAARALSIRRGVIDLAEEEAAGGHTILKHVAKDDKYLLQRLAAEPRIPGADTFTSLDQAEESISEALKGFQTDIAEWAKSGAVGTFRRKYQASRIVGRVTARGSTAAQPSSIVQFVLKKSTVSGKVYFLLTAYPGL